MQPLPAPGSSEALSPTGDGTTGDGEVEALFSPWISQTSKASRAVHAVRP